MKKMLGLMVVVLVLVAMAGTAGAAVGYEDEGAEVGITAIGIEIEEGADVVATGVDDARQGSIAWLLAIGAGVVLLGGGMLVLRKRKALG
jgi:LPXTG-motif cell wall-anchored protein